MTSPLPPFGFFELCAACGLPRHIGGSCGVPPSPPFPVAFKSVKVAYAASPGIFHREAYLEITCPRCGYTWREATVSNVEGP